MEMSSVQCLRRFVNERLSAAAEEIFGVFEKTVVVYEEEVVRQRRLLDILLKPEIKLHRTEYCTQERNSSVDQENPEPPKIKEEQELLSISLQGEQLGLKQETENFMLTPASVGSDRSQDQILFLDPGEHQCASGTQLPASICSSWLKNTRSEVPEPDHQLLSGNANETESQDHKKGNIRKKKSAKGARRTRATRCIKTSIAHKNTQSNKKPFKCNTPYACKVCGRYFRFRLNRDQHTRSHIGTKLCDTCGESFNNSTDFTTHMKLHKRELHICEYCGKKFALTSYLIKHLCVHTGNRPYECLDCNKNFCIRSDLTLHSVFCPIAIAKKKSHITQ